MPVKLRVLDENGRLMDMMTASQCRRRVRYGWAIYAVVTWDQTDLSLARPVRFTANLAAVGKLSLFEELIIVLKDQNDGIHELVNKGLVARHWQRRDWMGTTPRKVVEYKAMRAKRKDVDIRALCRDLIWWARTGHARSNLVVEVGNALDRWHTNKIEQIRLRRIAQQAAGGGAIARTGDFRRDASGRRREVADVQAVSATRGQ